ncbi:MAG: sulfatase-like hydrolase/transferase [Mangrovibacterium sp.]
MQKIKLLTTTLLLLYSITLKAQDQRPNVVLILADDLGFECIGANGGTSYQTPFIDKLAAQGMRFENCHSQPLCTPSRVQIMTGRYNVRNYTQFGTLNRDEISFGQLFQNAGYKTVIAGKWQLGTENDSPQYFGFEQSCLWQQAGGRTDEEGHDTRFSNPLLEINGKMKQYSNGEFGPDLVSDFLCDFIEENKEQAFFAYYPMLLTHCPFVPTPDSKDWDPTSKGSLDYKGEPKYYPDMVAYMDKMVGKIVSKIDELGLGDNTLIIFTGDNGTDQPVVSMLRGKEYPGGKSFTTDNGTHVPLVARWNKKIEANSECFDLIDFSDFFATICQAAQIKTSSKQLDGISFLPQLEGKKGNARKWSYCWFSRDGKTDKLKEFARNHEYKLYTTGEFFCVKDDLLEKHPLDIKKLSKDESRAYKMLAKALANYSDIRD